MTMSLNELVRVLKESRTGTHRPNTGVQRPTDAVRTRPLSPPDTSRPLTQPKPLRADAGRRATRPLASSAGGADRLDANLLANLIRWVGSVKSTFGIRQMRPILELYGVTGHMAPIVEQTIFHLATSDMLPDESGYETFTEDDLADALLRLIPS